MKNNNDKKVLPAFCYPNAEIFKAKILLNNKKKPGIYRWINNINNKSYVGSAKSLSDRLNIYYSTTLDRRLEKGSSAIYSAILKYSYSNFSLEIIEYCEEDLLIYREQYYIDLLKPEYNICKIAGSTLGKVHSEITKEKIRNSTKGKKHYFFGKHHTCETRKKIGEAHKLTVRSYIRPKMRIETKLRLSLVTIGLNVKVFDKENNLIKEFPSINSAAKYFGVNSTTIKTAIKKGRPYRNLIFKSQIKDKRIWVYDLNHRLVNILINVSKASEEFNIPSTTLSRYIKSRKLWKNKYFFYNTCL